MATNLRRYWDSACCFGYLANQTGRADACDRVLKDAQAGGCEILVSALTIAEVLHLKGEKRAFPRDMRDKIRGFFRQRCFVVADVDRFIAERAQDVFWDHDIQPKDAVHLATALQHGAHYLETYDGRLLDLSRAVGGDPQLVIQHPGTDLVEKAAQRERDRQARRDGLLFDLDGGH